MRVLVLGGGYAGLLVASKLESRLADADLTLVDETGDHLIQHELHRVIRRPEFVDAISVPLTDALDETTVRVGTVEAVDRDAREVRLDDGDTLAYDVVVVALGAETDYQGVPGAREHGTPLKRLPHATRVRHGFESVLAAGGGRVVVAGAGLSGVQTAAELAQFAREEGVANHVAVVLLEADDRITLGFPDPFREAVRGELDRLGVEIRTGAPVTRVDEESVHVDGDPLPYDQLVWTGGVSGPDALDGERVAVNGSLALDERTFVVGDAGDVVDAEGHDVPASAQAAVRASPTVADNVCEAVAAIRENREPEFDSWTFETPGWFVSVGDSAVAQMGPEVFTGPTANLVKSAVGVTYLADHGSVGDALAVLREEVAAERDLLDAVRERVGD